jgi:hypothetical protein
MTRGNKRRFAPQRPAESPAGADNSAFIRAAQRLRDTLNYIDRELGEGYADAHPSLIAALAQTAALEACADSLGYALDELRDALHPSPGIAPPACGRLAMLKTLARLVRPDCRKVGRVLSRAGTYTEWDFVRLPLTDDRLRQHLADTRVVSVYPMGSAGSNTTLVGVFDVDRPAVQRMGGAYCRPPLFQSSLSPRARPSGVFRPTFRSKLSP